MAGREVSEPRLHPHGTSLVYGVSTMGVSALVLHQLDGSPERQLTAHPQPRTARGLGGGTWCWTGDGHGVVYVAGDGNLWLQPVPGGAVRRLTDHGPERSASAPHAAAGHERVAYVIDQGEVWSVMPGTGAVERHDDGFAAFCLDPFVAPDGSMVSWQAWDVPDMPWDGAWVEFVEPATGWRRRTVAAGALQQPRALPDGTQVAVRDDTGWLNVWLGDAPLVDESFEHAGPTWGPGQCSYAWSPDGSEIAFTRNERGFGRLCVVDVAGRTVREVAKGVHGQLSWASNHLAAVRTGARTPTQVVVYDTTTWQRTVVAVGPVSGWEDEALVEPQLLEVPTDDGAVFARAYLADEPTDRMLCWLHGGPTDQWQVTFMPRIAYWRSRGFNVVVPDHRGSTGHGRDYQQALRGRWGELDVTDTIAVIEAGQRAGWGVAARTVLMGSSAGGFTALGVAARAPELVAGAVVAYPVTDLAELGERSHRFERHYTDTLVGPLPAAAALLAERSPVHAAHRLRHTPLLVLHGDADPVVPVEQSKVLAERVRAAGGDVELQVYTGEGHGFRQVATQLDEYARIEAFLTRVVGSP